MILVVLCPCFLFFCCTLFAPCLSLYPLQLILAEAKNVFALSRLLHFKYYPQLGASSAHLKLFQSPLQALWEPNCFALGGCQMTASLTCDTDLPFTLLNYLRRKHEKPMINVYIVWICKATSVISRLYIYTMLLLCSSSVFEFSAIPMF